MSIEWVGHDEVAAGPARRRQVVLSEFQLGHVPEFRQVFIEHFAVSGRVLPEQPGWFRGPTGGLYKVILTARSGAQVPVGVEVAALPERFVPLKDTTVNTDLWEFLRWVVERAGAPWTLEGLGQLAALYRIPEGQEAAG